MTGSKNQNRERIRILMVDDDPLYRKTAQQLLRGKYDLYEASDSAEAEALLAKSEYDVILLDVKMRTPREGLDAIARLQALDEKVAIVMTSGVTELNTVREAMRRGALDYIPKSTAPDEFIVSIERVLANRAVRETASRLKDSSLRQNARKHKLVGESQPMQTLRQKLEKLRDSDVSVVITGETGSGKEVVARSLRKTLPDGMLEPFVAVDSATITGSLAESILFGHMKGAFTGAEQNQKGIFEQATGGILFFDEVSNMPLDIQAKLLRVLQEREVKRIGSDKTIPVDVRVIVATNKSLPKLVALGQFKEDLFQRLNVIPIEIPPLRERVEDIPALIEYLLSQSSAPNQQLSFTDEAIRALKSYDWPGNVRELANTIAYVATLAEEPRLELADLPPRIQEFAFKPSTQKPEPSVSAVLGTSNGSFYDRMAEIEKNLLIEEYKRSSENVSQMAVSLRMDRSHLHSKLRLHGIKRSGSEAQPARSAKTSAS